MTTAQHRRDKNALPPMPGSGRIWDVDMHIALCSGLLGKRLFPDAEIRARIDRLLDLRLELRWGRNILPNVERSDEG
jgi:hypothetical protein